MKISEVLCLLVVVGLSCALPRSRSGYFPRSYMLGGSYYANPRFAREGSGYEYLPPGQMTAMVVGDTVATNSFSGGSSYVPSRAVVNVPLPAIDQFDDDRQSEQVTEKQSPLFASEPDSINETEPEEVSEQPGEQEIFAIEDATTETLLIPTTKLVPSKARKNKASRAKRPVVPPKPAEEDEDDEDDGLPSSWPFGGAGRAGVPAYNAFFPVFIGGSSGRSRTRSTGAQEESYPGSATAIANSFSTGKGGVATSHATSFGDPYAAAMLRNSGLFSFKTKSNRKRVALQEDEE